ncbi:hypothetical protein Cali_139 [Mycobacterium phage Cali]|uniref:Uncharacterized protein n=45 Tax=Bixzunavirus TaxID=680114 RepID=Q853E0_BPMBZ|nr:gp141 [Mycobacterium phage Bxz1]YP_002224167.1 hypothetical protein SCOTTMCG_139 [Mycobacterium phage ScottMcG]YP_002224391.1 gp142 [Mycobacterium phage Spud]YP_002224612.1 gp139 [Mycobacterium phage Cali]YP_002224831.1 gp138 [Mycobacterium phage Rizal]YP_003347810.1 hypothetical protein ET08_131 [Mycobacterium phage ET08]YP_008060942.1 hypothetical protein M181_gp185 [Mycobacterium phage Gizmo]YP_008061398.1 hypothetical protein M180_gp182 [Mycobacterium phage ArcherS7]YP_009012922.1 hy
MNTIKRLFVPSPVVATYTALGIALGAFGIGVVALAISLLLLYGSGVN